MSMSTLKEPRLGLLRYRKDKIVLKNSVQCPTSPDNQLYNTVASFILTLLYPKCPRSTHTRCFCACVARKAGAMLIRPVTGEKAYLGPIQKYKCRQHTPFATSHLSLQDAKVKRDFLLLITMVCFLSTMMRAASKYSHTYSDFILV